MFYCRFILIISLCVYYPKITFARNSSEEEYNLPSYHGSFWFTEAAYDRAIDQLLDHWYAIKYSPYFVNKVKKLLNDILNRHIEEPSQFIINLNQMTQNFGFLNHNELFEFWLKLDSLLTDNKQKILPQHVLNINENFSKFPIFKKFKSIPKE